MISADRNFILTGLHKTLAALAVPGEEALLYAPAGSARADELALDFENFATAFLSNYSADLSEEQRSAIETVDRLLGSMSGTTNEALWTDAAVIDHPRWKEVRQAAAVAIQLLSQMAA